MAGRRIHRAKARPLGRTATVVGPGFSQAEAPTAGFGGPALCIFLTAVTIRLLHVWQMRDTLYLSVLLGDSRGYDKWAQQIAAGEWVGREVFYQAPLYPYFLSVIYAVFGRDLVIVRVVQAVFGALSCGALGYAASRLISRPAGTVAGLMLALYAPAIFFDGLIQKSILDVLFVCVSLALIGKIVASEDDRRAGLPWLLLGTSMAALSLTRENALALVVCILFWAVMRGTSQRRRLAPALLVVAGLAVILLPVALRNYAVGGGFYLTTSQFGSNLFIGNNERSDGSYLSLRAGRGSPEYERIDATELAEEAVGQPLTPAEVSSYWTDRTLAFIAAEPGAWLALMARKVTLLGSATEMIDTESLESHAEYSWPLRLAGAVWNFGVLLPFAGLGMVILWPHRRRLWIVYAMTAIYALSVIAFFVVARYRYPLVPFLMIFGAAGVLGLPSFIREVPRPRLVLTAAAAVAMIVIAFRPLHTAESRRAITENNLGTALQEDGRVSEAVDRYRRALALDATYTPALNNLGTALRAAGRLEEALDVYKQALVQKPDGPGVHYNLANTLMAQGQTAEAIAHYQRALEANPQLVEAHNNLGLALEAQGRIDEAIAAWRKALTLDARSAQAHSNLGNALASHGDPEAGVVHLQQSIALAPGIAATHHDLGSLLLAGGAFGPAASALREAVRLQPDYPEAHNNLGIALASQGHLGEAVKHWQEALRLKPEFADARRNLELATGNRR